VHRQTPEAGKRETLDEEAARRFLAARDSNDPTVWNEAYAWIAADPEHGVAFARAEAAWAVAARLDELAPVIAPEAIAGPAGRFEAAVGRRHVVAGILASGLFGTAATVAWQKSREVERLRTAIGEARNFRLADGSHLFLNTNSAVEVALREDRRFLRLLRGEASISVAPDSRPLLINAAGIEINAGHGRANLRLRPDLLEMTVIDGLFRIAGFAAAVPALTGAAIRAGQVATSALTATQAARRLAWQSGLVQFIDDTLTLAVDEFNRYRSAPLVIGDPEIASLRIDGIFSTSASDAFVGRLGQDFGIRRVVGADRSVLLLRAAAPA
jgi:transmembrane sensor